MIFRHTRLDLDFARNRKIGDGSMKVDRNPITSALAVYGQSRRRLKTRTASPRDTCHTLTGKQMYCKVVYHTEDPGVQHREMCTCMLSVTQ